MGLPSRHQDDASRPVLVPNSRLFYYGKGQAFLLPGQWKYAAEIIHTNPAFMHPDTGAKLGLKEGDEIKISVYRPTGHTYRSGEKGVLSLIHI